MHEHRHQEPESMIQATQGQAAPPRGIKRFSNYPILGRLFRFLIWWLAFMGIYASSSVCPFCGQAGCPVGLAGAGVVGGFFALVVGKGKTFSIYLKRALSRIGSKLKIKSTP